MTPALTSSLRWLRRHAIPAVAVTLIAGAAAGGGIAYAATSSRTSTPASSAPKGSAATGSPAVPDRAPGAPLARTVLAIVVKDTGLKLADIKADLQKGESLDQVAGANATKLENDIVTTIEGRRSGHLPAAWSGTAASRLFGHLPAAWTGTASTQESRIRARVHAILTMPGTDLLKLLDTRPGLAAGAFAPPAPHHDVRPPATAKPSAAA